MPLGVGAGLSASNSEKYVVSIRIEADGFIFSGYVPGHPQSFFLHRPSFASCGDYGQRLKEYFFDNEYLSWDYREVRVIPVSSRYTLVPRPFFEETKKERIMTLLFVNPSPCYLTNTTCDDEVVIIFDIPPDIHSFCMRSFTQVRFIHPITPQLTFFRRQSRSCLTARMYGIIQDNALHVFCFRGGRILLVNTYGITAVDDILYYLLCIWSQMGFEQEKDELYLFSGNSDYNYNALTGTLSTYVRHIHPVEFPSEAYFLGTVMEQAAVDIRLLPVCE
ncbi:MAG: DUF3822 family protein [Tannerellaceae bacterium]|jgi:hypothetical protein|nr:DUF3822 family protein [Tannerellaceae bacterium]